MKKEVKEREREQEETRTRAEIARKRNQSLKAEIEGDTDQKVAQIRSFSPQLDEQLEYYKGRFRDYVSKTPEWASVTNSRKSSVCFSRPESRIEGHEDENIDDSILLPSVPTTNVGTQQRRDSTVRSSLKVPAIALFNTPTPPTNPSERTVARTNLAVPGIERMQSSASFAISTPSAAPTPQPSRAHPPPVRQESTASIKQFSKQTSLNDSQDQIATNAIPGIEREKLVEIVKEVLKAAEKEKEPPNPPAAKPVERRKQHAPPPKTGSLDSGCDGQSAGRLTFMASTGAITEVGERVVFVNNKILKSPPNLSRNGSTGVDTKDIKELLETRPLDLKVLIRPASAQSSPPDAEPHPVTQRASKESSVSPQAEQTSEDTSEKERVAENVAETQTAPFSLRTLETLLSYMNYFYENGPIYSGGTPPKLSEEILQQARRERHVRGFTMNAVADTAVHYIKTTHVDILPKDVIPRIPIHDDDLPEFHLVNNLGVERGGKHERKHQTSTLT